MTDKFLTIDDWAKFMLDRFNDLQNEFDKHLDTVPEEAREAVGQKFLSEWDNYGNSMKFPRDFPEITPNITVNTS